MGLVPIGAHRPDDSGDVSFLATVSLFLWETSAGLPGCSLCSLGPHEVNGQTPCLILFNI